MRKKIKQCGFLAAHLPLILSGTAFAVINDPNTTLQRLAVNAIFRLFALALSIALAIGPVFIVIGGFMYMTAQGDQEKVARAHKTIFGALVGTVVAFLAKALLNIVLGLVEG